MCFVNTRHLTSFLKAPESPWRRTSIVWPKYGWTSTRNFTTGTERMEKCYESYVIDVIVDRLRCERESVRSLFKK